MSKNPYDYLKERWVGHKDKLRELVNMFPDDPEWYKSEHYKVLMDSLGPLPENMEAVEKDLRGANLSELGLQRAKLSGANLMYADLSRTWLVVADLSGADLYGANLSQAMLGTADLSGARLTFANLSGAQFGFANLSGANLSSVIYTTDEIFDRLTKWWIPKYRLHILFLKQSNNWSPINVTDFARLDTTKVDGSTNPVLKRHMEDYQFIQGFKEKSWFHRHMFYPLWKGTSDCGRSLLLWLMWSMGFVGLFAKVYSCHLDWFTTTTAKPVILDWFNVLYFSVVTFTTLGFGDVSARLDNRYAQGWVMAEVIIGYIMLGGLISILANKLARRA